MHNDILNELSRIEKVELVYSNTKYVDKLKFISYKIIIDGDNILADINTCKKVIAIMEINKELLSSPNVKVFYEINSSNDLENCILRNNKKVIEQLQKAEILYLKDDYYIELIENLNSKTNTRA